MSISYQSLLGLSDVNTSALITDTLSVTSAASLSGTLAVTGLTTLQSLTIPTGAALSKILTSNASGVATWQFPAAITLVGDVTGLTTATVVAKVGGQIASTVAAATLLANAATNLNTFNAIVKRDGSGGFSAGPIAATTLSTSGVATLNSVNTSSITTAATTLSLQQTGSVAPFGTTKLILQALTGCQGAMIDASSCPAGSEYADLMLKAPGNSCTLRHELRGPYQTNPANATFGETQIRYNGTAGQSAYFGAVFSGVSGDFTAAGLTTTTLSTSGLATLNSASVTNNISCATLSTSGLATLDSATITNGATAPFITLNGVNAAVYTSNSNIVLAAMCSFNTSYFTDALINDTAYRNIGGSLRFGTSGTSQLQIKTSGVSITSTLSVTALATLNGGIKLLTTGGTASTLDCYEETTFSLGFTTVPLASNPTMTLPFIVRRIGKTVTLHMWQATNNVNSSTCTSWTATLASRFALLSGELQTMIRFQTGGVEVYAILTISGTTITYSLISGSFGTGNNTVRGWSVNYPCA